VTQRQEDLETLKRQRQEKEIKLADLRSDDIKSLVGKDDPIEQEIKDSLDQLGVPKAVKTFSELAQVSTEAHTVAGRAAALLTAVVNGKNRRLLFLLMPVVLIGIPAQGGGTTLPHWRSRCPPEWRAIHSRTDRQAG
jgi:hypothetical protein